MSDGFVDTVITGDLSPACIPMGHSVGVYTDDLMTIMDTNSYITDAVYQIKIPGTSLGGGNMLYLVGSTVIVEEDSGIKKEVLYGPEAFIADSCSNAKLKALARWGVREEKLDDIEVYCLPFQKI